MVEVGPDAAPLRKEAPPFSSIGILGHGNFGRLLEKLANDFFPDVPRYVFDPKPEDDVRASYEAIARCDIVFLAVPMHSLPEALEEIRPHLRTDTVLVNVATVQGTTADCIRALLPDQPFISAHPMFGPEGYKKRGEQVRGMRIVVTDIEGVDDAVSSAYLSALADAGLEVIAMSTAEHDALLSRTLFITHLIGQSVAALGYQRTAGDMSAFGSLMDAVESVTGDTKLFKDVYTLIPGLCDMAIARVEKAILAVETSLYASGEDGPDIPDATIVAFLVGKIVMAGGFERTEIDTPSFESLMSSAEAFSSKTGLAAACARSPKARTILARLRESMCAVVAALRNGELRR
jgi:prephenate dehydrogenase